MFDEGAGGRDLAVLVVAYRSADKLSRCLTAAQEHLPELPLYVWDNSGPLHSAVRDLAGHFPDVHWITDSENIGFAAAVNKLAEMTPGHDLLLLNPDAYLLGPLTATRNAIRQGNVAAAAPLVTEGGDRIPQPTFLLSTETQEWDVAHKPISLLNAICAKAMPPERLRGTFLSDRYRRKPTNVSGYLTGACLAISRDAWDALKPFDEAFFLYGEEAEWQARARAAGWRLRLAHEVGVRHEANGTVAGDSLASRRSDDLLRAGVALQLEYRYGEWAANVYTAAVSLIEAIKSQVRRQHAAHSGTELLFAVDDGVRVRQTDASISAATELSARGHSITLVSLGPLGSLPRHLPPSIRLIRRPWWWPSTAPDRSPRTLVADDSRRARAFARLFRLGRGRIQISPSAAMAASASTHVRTAETATDAS